MNPLTWIIGDARTGEQDRTICTAHKPAIGQGNIVAGEIVIGIEARPAKARGRMIFADLSSPFIPDPPALGAVELTASQ